VLRFLREKRPQTLRTSRPGVEEQKSEEKGTVPSIKLAVGSLVGVVQNEAQFASDSGTVPRPAGSVWVGGRFVNVSGEKEEGSQTTLPVLWRWSGQATKRSN
jgi:hypothetical protein